MVKNKFLIINCLKLLNFSTDNQKSVIITNLLKQFRLWKSFKIKYKMRVMKRHNVNANHRLKYKYHKTEHP